MRLAHFTLSASLLVSATSCATGVTEDDAIPTTPEPVIGRDAEQDPPEDAAEDEPLATDDAEAAPFDAGRDASTTNPDAAATSIDGGGGAQRDAGLDAGADSDAGRSDGGRADAGSNASIDAASSLDAAPSAPPAAFPYTPSNVALAGIEFASAPDSTLNCGTTEVDTSGAVTLRNWCGTAPKPVVRAQSGAPELVILPLKGLNLAGNNTLRVSGSRPLVLLVQGAASVQGTLDANARANTPGPGGNQMCGGSSGGDGTGNDGLDGAGGGGGGHATRGGNGGEDSGDARPGAGGATRGNGELTPLIAGCNGGRGGGCAGNAGAGGGAVQISASSALVVSGVVQARGGDGARGCGNDAGGTGAGSGGSLLLEGATIDRRGTLNVSGGNGGDGQGDGAGGQGANASGAAGTNGRDGSGSGGGGGGGGYGRVRLRAMGTCTGC